MWTDKYGRPSVLLVILAIMGMGLIATLIESCVGLFDYGAPL